MNTQPDRDLIGWQKSMDLVVSTYQVCRCLPDTEKFGLTSQLQRAIVSVPSNIAEGYGRLSSGDYARFLTIARGSLMEAETQLQIAIRLNYVDGTACELVWRSKQEVGRLLNGLLRAVHHSKTPSEISPKS